MIGSASAHLSLRGTACAFSILVLTIVTCTALAGCRGGGPQLSWAVDTPAADQAWPGGAALPALGDLPKPPRDASLLGPGWTPLNPLDGSHKILTNGCTGTPAGQLVITGAASTGFSIFAIQGFDGDAFPTSIRTTLGAITGQYYVAFSDYVSGTWQHVGPFTNSAEIEIPGLDAYTSHSAFTNPDGIFYFTLLVGGGSTITIDLLEVGTFGGTLGPEPPRQIESSGGAIGLVLTWNHSPDYHAPDFAGYFVERAPLLFGNFAALNTDPVRDPYYHDPTAVAGVQYRYRVAAVDTAGNRSLWADSEEATTPGNLADPVPVVKMPDGPRYAPANVTFDLSGSFDPEGEAITSYEIEFAGGPAAMGGAGPTFTTTLQPGCYYIQFVAHTATRQGSTARTLKVYPRWNSSSVLVRNPEHVGWRKLIRARGWGNPADGFTLFGQDGSYPSLSYWQVQDATDFSLATLPCYDRFVDWIGEPLTVGDTVLVPVASTNMLMVASYTADSQQLDLLGERTADSPIAVAPGPEDGVFAIYSDKPIPAQTDLVIMKLGPGGTTQTVVANIGMLSALDVAYNPAAAAIDIVYADVVSTQWVRWDPIANAVVDSAVLAAAMSTWIDIEVSPATGLPSLVYGHTGLNRFSQLDSLGNWSPEVPIDNLVGNRTPFDLTFAPDGATPECFFGTVTPQSYLYEYSGGVWTRRNTVSYSTKSADTVALMPGASGREMYVADGLDNDDMVLARLNEDGSEDVIWTLAVTNGQGHEMHSAAALDGLHVGWRDYYDGTGRHFMSPDGGETWNDMGSSSNPVSNIDMAATSDGALYMSIYDGVLGTCRLFWWDGTDFQLRMSFPGQSDYRPFFKSDNGTTIEWFAYEPLTSTLHHVLGDEIGGYADTPTVLNDNPVWTGVANSSLMYNLIFAVAGDAQLDRSPLGFYAVDSPNFDPLLDPLLGDPFDFLNSEITRGRTLGTTTYMAGLSGLSAQVFYATQGTLVRPLRCEVPLLESPQLTELPMAQEFAPIDGRRTVSVKRAFGATAVALLSSIDGKDTYFEWSNFGDWERLPMPTGIEHMGGPELVVDRDGRWCIVYKDYATDQIRSISTR